MNGTEDRQWRTVDNGGTVEDLYNGDKVYARITDGEQASSPQEKQILDTKAPAQANIELNTESYFLRGFGGNLWQRRKRARRQRS